MSIDIVDELLEIAAGKLGGDFPAPLLRRGATVCDWATPLAAICTEAANEIMRLRNGVTALRRLPEVTEEVDQTKDLYVKTRD